MTHFTYHNGLLCAEQVDLSHIARELPTPFYCYSAAVIIQQYEAYAQAFAGMNTLICYALKANSNQAVLTLLARHGAGMDVVSEGELRRARAAGVPGEKITFSGVAKTAAEIAYALEQDILCFNVESEPELRLISSIATQRGQKARIALRVNPDVDAKTHKKITTGKTENKFGIPLVRAWDVYEIAARLPGLEVTGIDMHIGSQLLDLAPFAQAFEVLAAFVERLRAAGVKLKHIDIGGGLGIPYRKTDAAAQDLIGAYVNVVKQVLWPLAREMGAQIIIEPGRSVVGNAGVLVTQVIYIKHEGEKTFVIVDAGMNDLIRPTLYDAYHAIEPLRQAPDDVGTRMVDVVGPVCETGDYFAQHRRLPPVEPGDLLAIHSAGAYGAVQAGTYNSRLLIPEVLVKGDEWAVIRPRETYDALIAQDVVPDWVS